MTDTTIKLQPATDHLIRLRNDILDAIRFFFPIDVVPTVDRHDGDFGVREIEHYAKTAPAIILVTNGGESVRKGGIINEEASYAIFIMTKGKTQRQRTDGALLIYEHFLKLLHDTDWNTQECVGDPTDIKSVNLYGEELDELGMALWSVQWTQLVQIPYLTDEDVTSLNDFATLFATNTAARPTELPGDIEASEQAIKLETT